MSRQFVHLSEFTEQAEAGLTEDENNDGAERIVRFAPGTEVGMIHIEQDNGWKIEPIMHI